MKRAFLYRGRCPLLVAVMLAVGHTPAPANLAARIPCSVTQVNVQLAAFGARSRSAPVSTLLSSALHQRPTQRLITSIADSWQPQPTSISIARQRHVRCTCIVLRTHMQSHVTPLY